MDRGYLVGATPPRLYTDSFETSLMFWSWSEDMHVIWIKSSYLFLSYDPQLKVYHFCSIFHLQCYQYLINVFIYVVPLSANAHTVLYIFMKHLYMLMSWPEDVDILWIKYLCFVSVSVL